MKLLAFAASNSRNSINRSLVHYAASRLSAKEGLDVEIEFLDLNDFNLPIFSIDLENESGIPGLAKTFFEKMGSADALLISFAVHNGSVTAVWKNMFDWMSRIDKNVWQSKPMVIMAATPGARAGASVLEQVTNTAPHFAGNIKGSVGIGHWQEAFNKDTQVLVNSADVAALDAALENLG